MKRQLSFDVEYDYSLADSILLDVALTNAAVTIRAKALVDTGASVNIFKREVCESLHLDVESDDVIRISTVTGLFTAYGHTLTLQTLGLEFETKVYFAEHEGLPRNVLGRKGWLDRVRLGLIEADAKLFVSRYDD